MIPVRIVIVSLFCFLPVCMQRVTRLEGLLESKRRECSDKSKEITTLQQQLKDQEDVSSALSVSMKARELEMTTVRLFMVSVFPHEG